MKTAWRKPQEAEIPRTPSRKASAIVVGFRWSQRWPTTVIPATDSAASRYPDPDLATAFTRRLYDKDRLSRLRRDSPRLLGGTKSRANLVTFHYLNDNNRDAQDSRAVAGGMLACEKDRQVQALSWICSRRGQDPHHADRGDPAPHPGRRCGDRCCGNPWTESGRGTGRVSGSGAPQNDRV